MIHRTGNAERGTDDAADGSGSGVIDYRLARQAVINDYRAGRLAPREVCDAQPELRRVAHSASRPVDDPCPICEQTKLALVSFVFGPRLPAQGRCVTNAQELAKLRKASGSYTLYVVEVCRSCWWNHLQQTVALD